MYQALYRKWRPKTFSDVIGQPHITETLRRQVAEGRTSHAYLFTGTRGTGKTTCAKILARAVNCEHPVDGDPCNQCGACRGLEDGSFLDVLELDAASNNGVEQVRALRDEAIYSPAHVKKRVYIIDEVHMLSTPAFNALLKILEEPPEHLMFILATTELHKVPATILSRCQRFSFKRITPADVAKRLLYVAGQERIGLTPDGAELLSRLADGALRDGLSLLDQCAAAGGTIDSAAVLEVLGLAGNLQTAQLMERILSRDARAALLLFNRLYGDGKDVGAVLGELSTLTRDLLLRKTAPEGGGVLLSGGFDGATLDRLGKDVPAGRFLYLASTLQKASADLYYSTNRRTDAELCLLRLCDESLSGDLTALDARIRKLEEAASRGEALRDAVRQSGRAEPPAEKRPPAGRAQKGPPTAAQAEEPVRSRGYAEEPPLPEEPGERVYDLPEETPQRSAEIPAERPGAPAAPPPWEEPGERAYGLPEETPQRSGETPAERPGAPAAPPPPWEEAPAPRETDVQTSGAPGGTPGKPAMPKPDAGPSAPPEAPKKTPGTPALDGSWWRALVESCKGRLSPMYRAFLDLCGGVLEGDQLTVYAPDEITLGRLDNDRVRGVLTEEMESAAGTAVRVVLRAGEVPKAAPKENLKNLLTFGSQFDNITIQ